MRRRDFVTVLGAGAAAWPLAARAQQQAMPVVGFIRDGSADSSAQCRRLPQRPLRNQLRRRPKRGGGVPLVQRPIRAPTGADGRPRRRVAVIAAPGGSLAAIAAKAATTTIPIVFGVGDDPVKLGLVASLARPGGNASSRAAPTSTRSVPSESTIVSDVAKSRH
jgi:hypothetical protein